MKRACADFKKQQQSRETVCEDVLSLLSLLANKTRFKILCLLREGSFCVSDIVDAVDQGGASNTSQQLRMLSLSGIVARHRKSKSVIYSLKNKKVKRLLRVLETMYLEDES